MLGATHGVMLWADMNAARGRSALCAEASMYTEGKNLIINSPPNGDVVCNGESFNKLVAASNTVRLVRPQLQRKVAKLAQALVCSPQAHAAYRAANPLCIL